jgi:transposase-like protein
MAMTLIDFQTNFGTEEQCRQYLFNKRWPEGFVCPKCGHKEHFNIACRHLYQCKACDHQASVTAGTIMDKTRTPLVKWFLAMYLMAEDKRGISALSLKSKLGISYNTAWTMSHKIRHAMGKRDEKYTLNGIVEMDEAFFGGPTEGGKRGRGTEKTAVIVSISLSNDGKPQFAKMEVIETVDRKTIEGFAERSVSKGSEIHTDGLSIYAGLAQKGYTLVKQNYTPKNQPKHLHWSHIIISNAKAFINGTFHGLDSIHLQRYLDEFCYRLNRRWFGLNIFSRILNASILAGKITGHELLG